MTHIETMKLALEALEKALDAIESWGSYASEYFQIKHNLEGDIENTKASITALRQAIAEAEQAHWVGVSDERLMEMPEFTKHTVETTADWSEWVCPDPGSYLLKCCDCGLVHEAQFGVVRYKSETEREDCDMVDDPNVQAVFRMRRHEAWEPEDTAHRAGGLPQSTEQEPVGEVLNERGDVDWISFVPTSGTPLYTAQPQRQWVGLTDEEIEACHDEIRTRLMNTYSKKDMYRVLEAKLKEKNT